MTIDDIPTTELPGLLDILLTDMRSEADLAEVACWRTMIATRPGSPEAIATALALCDAHLRGHGFDRPRR